jgi:archaetidylinositol phosphate synthase
MKLIRKHNAWTYEPEKRLLDFIAARIYRYVTADQLSLLAFAGAIIAAVFYANLQIALYSVMFASLGIFLHWFGDSLDGRVARLRDENRPRYGHYLDHILDAFSLVIIIFGISYSKQTMFSTWIWVLVIFLLMMIHSYLKSSITGVFELSFERFGATEARITLILMNIIIFVTGNPIMIRRPIEYNLLDLFGLIAATILLFILLKSVFQTLWGKDRIRDVKRKGPKRFNILSQSTAA